MREILYRGKRVDNGKWVYGNIVFTRSGRAFLLEGSFFSGESYEGDFKRGEIYGTEVIPETVGQYTALKDKNGKRIFEGDIVRRFNIKGKEIMRYTVEWHDDCCMFVLSYCGDDMGYDTDFTVFYGAELEVIGNVFDNSELLKGE